VIDQALDFLRVQVDNYLRMKLDPLSSTPFIQLANIAWHDSETAAGATGDASDAFISLINIEEDRVSRSQENYVRSTSNTIIYKNPKVYLNLYLLFSVNLSNYLESLKRLSYIIQFFQYRNVFTPLTSPSLPDGIEQLIFDLYTPNFQDLNNLWGIMGSKYLPSVIYKMRLISISEDFEQGTAGVIEQIVINDKNIPL
jgi:hypothetical protein